MTTQNITPETQVTFIFGDSRTKDTYVLANDPLIQKLNDRNEGSRIGHTTTLAKAGHVSLGFYDYAVCGNGVVSYV